ncbi:xylulokinase [Companilactobacillus sp.]|jgi:L-ribulokinase|uniref:xylulokinase n=1 Tax=Companilactobacillus sp. TaxID=2767905 RepID=UPI0025C07412|nr:FGGY-family carbohydrate kinase [Companilactobacillus sp.]MCH4008555.1 FGGY-family carbohydrate kinase [Companilactobacillus sp.]MCH4051266.1 FGGY-family carbohydrate kinase [Companilactobacillus sp.]MCH4076498.1 FGGY-family carbohydrate kinase [Companilactobacillus sp.]MCH4125073.1 FGGY-family carbohydrate kinase [Companilactobacillus sp.]MCH4131614.1 FGGY-family carbohydrate kinase [Companilactobacillus sp.]
MNLVEISKAIEQGKVSLGIELGSTRIKSVLVTEDFNTIASGSFTWENQYENDIWTYPIDLVWQGIQTSYSQMAAEVQSKYHQPLKNIGSIGISAMMHGYLAFNKKSELLVPFRTWRNNITADAAEQLTKEFNFNIPQRWCVAHLYQAILNKEEHVKDIDFITTLAGYVTWKLSGEKVLGIGDASGAFPIDQQTGDYSQKMLDKFANLDNVKQYDWDIKSILPKVEKAGVVAGKLTAEGAKLLDVNGNLEAGSIMAPPEGDAGTGMVGTNSVRKRTGNISVGTSAFSMVVLEKPLKSVHKDIDIVMTPDGSPVAMVHVNNCSSDINAWASLFNEFAARLGVNLTPDKLYEALFLEATKSDPNAGGLVNYSYQSGENITDIKAGRPLFVRTPNSKFNLPNFILTQLYAAFAPLKIGMNILSNEENINTDVMIAQGGLFKTQVMAQQVLANALNLPITVMGNAGEGGPWGMAVLAMYAKDNNGQTLDDYLDHNVFTSPESMTLSPEPEGVKGYEEFTEKYVAGLPIEATAGNAIKD